MSDLAPRPLDERSLSGWLRAAGLACAGDEVVVEAAGDGNINWVRRARVPGRGVSWVVKQARPALERFPQYRASTERIVFEERWLAIARVVDDEGICPAVLHFDEAARVLVLEDLADAERLDRALLRGRDVVAALCAVARLLARVHAATRDPLLVERFRNDDMQTLHGEHVFRLPFAPNDFPLEPALRARAERVWQDGELGAIAMRAYTRYREPRGALVHGDVQAGNVLLPTAGGVKLLDAEIAHVGDPAFDVGMLLAHVLLAGLARDALGPAAEVACTTWNAYASSATAGDAPELADVARYAGIEILRRTICAARVAAVADTRVALAAL
ncbi:phosphotransferase, partial [Candidatus Binatia bacterium]|nr:phosphotransferase [Candidatus Binatia bacterium]